MSVEPPHRETNGEWAVGIAVVVLGAGIAVGSPFLVALAVVPLSVVAALGFDSAPEPTVALHREFAVTGVEATVDDEEGVTGGPGERITVRLALENTGEEPLVDLRLVDGVPENVPVVSGTNRACVTVEPGAVALVTYEVELRRGEHAFEGAAVRTRGVGGTTHRTETVSVSGAQSLRCLPFVDDVPIDDGANDYAGEIPTDEGGSGVEFYSIRDYEPGDPVRSIDWRRYARSRELATVEFRAERATRVVCVLDRRLSQTRARSEAHLPALDLSIAAAERTFDAVVDAGYPAGAIAVNDRLQLVVEPGTDAETRTTARNLFDAIRARDREAGEHARTRWGSPTSLVPTLLPGEAQVVFFSSFVDDTPVSLVEQLRIRGYPVCVVSPDVASGRADTAGRLAALDRRTRLADVRATGARVVDWDVSQPIGLVLNQVVSEVSSR